MNTFPRWAQFKGMLKRKNFRSSYICMRPQWNTKLSKFNHLKGFLITQKGSATNAGWWQFLKISVHNVDFDYVLATDQVFLSVEYGYT